MQVIEGVSMGDHLYGPRTGVVTVESRQVPAGGEREPSGHMHQQVRVETECWFHPYTGGAPKRCIYPKERTTRCL